jgi:hypothetical protein
MSLQEQNIIAWDVNKCRTTNKIITRVLFSVLYFCTQVLALVKLEIRRRNQQDRSNVHTLFTSSVSTKLLPRPTACSLFLCISHRFCFPFSISSYIMSRLLLLLSFLTAVFVILFNVSVSVVLLCLSCVSFLLSFRLSVWVYCHQTFSRSRHDRRTNCVLASRTLRWRQNDEIWATRSLGGICMG